MGKLQVWNFYVGHLDYEDHWQSGPNSAGGVSIMLSFKNLTGKTIKYAGFIFVPKNAVGDVVRCSITGKSEDGIKYTGPLTHNSMATDLLWENAWYNNTITSVYLKEVWVDYMDGTSEVIYAKNIDFSKPSDAPGCYIATAIYGSYNCPEVWTLRRYRDYSLAETWYGRAFIKTYYALSPTFVKFFGKTGWFKKLFRTLLNRFVEKLQKKGIDSTPYDDKVWK